MIWALAYLGVGMVTLFGASLRMFLRGYEPTSEGCVGIVVGWPFVLCVGLAEMLAERIERAKSAESSQ